jgi:hypothetical protein
VHHAVNPSWLPLASGDAGHAVGRRIDADRVNRRSALHQRLRCLVAEAVVGEVEIPSRFLLVEAERFVHRTDQDVSHQPPDVLPQCAIGTTGGDLSSKWFGPWKITLVTGLAVGCPSSLKVNRSAISRP